MEGIDHIVEAEPHGRGNESLLVELAGVRLTASVEEPAATERALFVSCTKVLAKVGRERHSQLLQGHQLSRRGREIQQRATEGELVRRNVPSEHDDASPVVLRARAVMNERLAQVLVGSLAWDDMAHATPRVFNIAGSALDQVKVTVEDRLPRCIAHVRTNVEADD